MQWKLPKAGKTRQEREERAKGTRRGTLTDLHAGEDDIVLVLLGVAADLVLGLELLEVDAAEVGAAGDEEAPEVSVDDIVGLRRLLGGLGGLLGGLSDCVVGDHRVGHVLVFCLHGVV